VAQRPPIERTGTAVIPLLFDQYTPNIGGAVMIRLLTTTAIAAALIVPAAFAQTSHPNPVGSQSVTTVQRGMLDQQDSTLSKKLLPVGRLRSNSASSRQNHQTRRSNGLPSGWCEITAQRMPS